MSDPEIWAAERAWREAYAAMQATSSWPDSDAHLEAERRERATRRALRLSMGLAPEDATPRPRPVSRRPRRVSTLAV